MSDKYQDEVYKFFTEPENYRTMVSVSSHLDDIKDRLIDEFWSNVKVKLKSKLNEHIGNWTVEYEDDELWFYNHTWRDDEMDPIVTIGLAEITYGEDPFFGLFVADNDKYKKDKIREAVRAIQGINKYEDDNSHYWICWQRLPFSFGTYENLVTILPSNREPVEDKVVSNLLDLLNLVEDKLPLILQESKKWQRK